MTTPPFLARVVRYLTAKAGIRQFLDLGGGLPTGSNVHQVAQQIAPDARVVYVDYDPVVWSHGQALLVHAVGTGIVRGLDDRMAPRPRRRALRPGEFLVRLRRPQALTRAVPGCVIPASSLGSGPTMP